MQAIVKHVSMYGVVIFMYTEELHLFNKDLFNIITTSPKWINRNLEQVILFLQF